MFVLLRSLVLPISVKWTVANTPSLLFIDALPKKNVSTCFRIFFSLPDLRFLIAQWHSRSPTRWCRTDNSIKSLCFGSSNRLIIYLSVVLRQINFSGCFVGALIEHPIMPQSITDAQKLAHHSHSCTFVCDFFRFPLFILFPPQNIKFNHFSRQHSSLTDFPGTWNNEKKNRQPCEQINCEIAVTFINLFFGWTD